MIDARTLTLALGGKWFGRYGSARCPAHGDRRPSLSLSNGNCGRLLMKCHAGCSFPTIKNALQNLGLVEGMGHYAPPSPTELARLRKVYAAEVAKQADRALAIWRECQPVNGTLGETYLRGRGIACSLPETLRFHPACWHPTAKRFPALVALVEGVEGFAVHRTYLRVDGGGKASVEPAKAMLGHTRGGAVMLTDADGPLVICEGVETGLSLASGLLRYPATIWAALSTSGIKTLRLPDLPGRLTIATDGDEPGRAAGHDLATRATALGWKVSPLPAPDGLDWNDVLVGNGVTT